MFITKLAIIISAVSATVDPYKRFKALRPIGSGDVRNTDDTWSGAKRAARNDNSPFKNTLENVPQPSIGESPTGASPEGFSPINVPETDDRWVSKADAAKFLAERNLRNLLTIE